MLGEGTLAELTVTRTVPVLDPPYVSLTTKLNKSVPTKSVAGV